MPEDIYIVHNAFSLLLSISLTTTNPNTKSTIVFAHKKANETIKSIQSDFKLANTKLIPYSKALPPLQTVLRSKYSRVFLSNPWHKRIIPFYLTISNSKQIHLIDDGFATINENYESAIQQNLGNTALTILKSLNNKIEFDTHYSIFEKPSNNFLNAHKTNKRITILPESILKAFVVNTNLTTEKDTVIILGSTHTSALQIMNTLPPEKCGNFQFLLKDHPNLSGGLDQLGCPPEFFLMRHMHSIKKIYHCKSSTAYISNYLFPNVETEEYTNAQ